MKLSTIAASLLLLSVAASNAGTADNKAINEPEPLLYGTGLYLAPQGGFNVFHATPDAGRPGIGNRNVDVGGFVGGKIGYVFGKGLIRPAIEADLFYNRFGGSWDRVFLGEANRRHREFEHYQIDSGAFMENEVLRLNLGKFQPYVGAGVGVYTEDQAQQQTNTIFKTGKVVGRDNLPSSKTSLAWQVIAGTDLYLSHRVSLFAEYKFLNYMDMNPHGRLGQQLVGAGVRYHF